MKNESVKCACTKCLIGGIMLQKRFSNQRIIDFDIFSEFAFLPVGTNVHGVALSNLDELVVVAE